MRKISRLYWLGVGLLLETLLFPIIVSAQQPFPWESTLESAQRNAAQSNRLVLIHFWAPWCGACNRMEAEVFSQPGGASALLAHYVPVKINADLMPSTATKYGITGLPTEVVITPQGQVVDSLRGRTEATQFIVRLNQIASARQQNAGQTAQVPANIPPFTTDRSTAEQSTAGNQPAGNQSLSDDRYVDYYHRSRGDQRDQPPLSAATASREPVQPSTATVVPPYGQQQQQPAVGPDLSGPSLGQLPAANITQQSPPISNQFSPPVANTTQQVPPASNPTSASPAANPALCLDGYCPVSLIEKQQWIPGDRRFGAIHRGRTYLFAGQEEQRRFFTDPDRYAPVISGNDIVQAMEKGQMAPGMREHGVTFNGHIFLFADEAALEKFSKNPAYYANQALEAIQDSNHTGQQLR